MISKGGAFTCKIIGVHQRPSALSFLCFSSFRRGSFFFIALALLAFELADWQEREQYEDG